MFQEEYIRDLRSNYLVLSEADQAYDEFQIKMLMNNRIKGLLECEIRIIDGQEKFLYEISSKQPISRIYERTKLDYDTLISILRGIAGAVESAGEYLLDTRHFILQPEYMYMNPETKKISLCFFPLYEAEPEQAFHKLAEYVLDKIDYQEERAVVLAYDFYRRAKEDNFNIRSVLNKPVSLGKDICFEQNPVRKRSSVAEEKPQEPPEQNKKPVKELVEEKRLFIAGMGMLILLIGILLWIQIYQPVILLYSRSNRRLALVILGGMGSVAALVSFAAINRIYCRKNQEKVEQAEEEIQRRYHAEEAIQKIMTEETCYCGETTLLTRSEEKSLPRLIHIKDGKLQEIMIGNSPFIIGKMSRGVDAVIQDQSVSRMHAKISKQEGSYFLTDLNSKNGTYKNGVRLNANETTAIRQDDEIRFADLTFYFACC